MLCLGAARALASGADAYIVGDRLFPATPLTDDPFVADAVEISVMHQRFRGPPLGQTDFGLAVERRITPDLGIEVEDQYTIVAPDAGPNAYGFGNVEAALKYQLWKNEPHETLLTLGVSHEFGGTGAERIGAESVGATTPSVYFGKGFGDLPESLKYLRPLAVTGLVGYQIADTKIHKGEHFPDMVNVGLSLQYSFRYLQGNVAYVGLPPLVDRLTPIVEFSYSTPAGAPYGQPDVGLFGAGLVYSRNGIDLGVEALIPLNGASGRGVGAVALAHVPLGNLLPALGRPLFGD
ncbi:MAG TPA: hypothetical protein VFA12_11435 [Stellaceae bacterium]|nr:hypothetical protein [Stellaceae bacterium]